MRFAVIGAGGVGGFFGARLVEAGQEVHFVARGRTLDVLRGQGLTIVSGASSRTMPVRATDDPSDIGQVDYVLSCVKATQVIDALESAYPGIRVAQLGLLEPVGEQSEVQLLPAVAGG